MFRGPRTRGTSVLAALVFVAILGGVAMAVSSLSPESRTVSISSASQLGQTVAAKTTAPKTETPKDCTAAIQAALNRTSDPMVTVSDKGESRVGDTCFGAVSKTGKASAKAVDYMCVGRSGTALYANSQLSVTTIADPAEKAGSCRVNVCSGDLQHCSAAKLYSGGIVASERGLTTTADASIVNYDPTLSGGSTNGTGPLTTTFNQPSPDSGFINSAFGGTNAFESGAAPIAGTLCPVGQNCSVADLSRLASGPSVFQNGTAAISLSPNGSVGGTGLNCSNGNCATLEPKDIYGQKTTGGTPDGSKQVTPQCPGGNCNSTTLREPPSNPRTPADSQPEKSGGSGMFNDLLKGVLQGLTQGLSKALSGSNAASCSSDPNLYAQQQQQYNQQLQQYNLQLQQYNYQSQYAQMNGYPAPTPPTPPQQCQRDSNSNTCPAAPQQPSTTCNGSWKPVTTQQSNGSQCTTSWQCVAAGSTQPTAQISCQPLVADVGMSLAIAYTCGNATGSTGLGFDTTSATSGATTTLIATPPAGVNTATYGVQCTNQTLSAKAECSIQIGRPSIVLVATPKIVKSGENATIGWITSGMKSCVVSSPTLADFTAQNATNTSVSGAATTPKLTADADFLLQCTTVGGATRAASTTVQIATTTTS